MDREIFDQQGNLLETYDPALGYLTNSTRTIHHEAVKGVEEVWHYETVKEYPNGGKDVVRVIDVPGVEARAAWDEDIHIYIYIPYTAEELAAMEAERNKLTPEERLAALEQENTHLKETLEIILSGDTGEVAADG